LLTGDVYIRQGLSIPDGITVSDDLSWIAVSNHSDHSVYLYEQLPSLQPCSEPTGVLRGVAYPHGVRFSRGSEWLLVADAGAPFVHIYRSEQGNWSGEHMPTMSLRVMDEMTFQRGHECLEEGGPKGIDIHHAEALLVYTCTERTLGFIDLTEAMSVTSSAPNVSLQGVIAERRESILAEHIRMLCRQQRVRTENHVLAINRGAGLMPAWLTDSANYLRRFITVCPGD
jgi:hypothetical protein